MKKLLLIIIILFLTVVGYALLKDNIVSVVFAPTESSIKEVSAPQKKGPLVFAEKLDIPWEVIYLNDEILVTERPGTIAVLDASGMLHSRIAVPGVSARSESGLLGMAVDPDFSENNYLYLYETYDQNGTKNRVARYVYRNGNLGEKTTLIDEIPGAQYHDGGRIAFGPDDMLYIATGDAVIPEIAQDLSSLGGKILRIQSDGSIPEDNPFEDSPVYSYGHRNPQGLTWDAGGDLWSTEHGPSGFNSGNDELNRIVPGGNYGWPHFAGETQQTSVAVDRDAFIFPTIHSGDTETWAPAGLTFHNGYLMWGGLRGQSLYRTKIVDNEVIEFVRLYSEEYGRIRTTFLDTSGNLGFTTSNTDGRGSPAKTDDRIIIVQ